MNDIEDKTEVVQISLYSNIICQLLKAHDNLSLCKVLVFSYLIKQNNFIGKNIYTARNTRDIVYKGLSLLSGDYDCFCNSVGYILKACHLLNKKGIIIIDKALLRLQSNALHGESIYEESPFLKKVVEESKKMTDKQFMKEVTYNV